MEKRRLYRKSSDSMVCGVCSGLADYINADVSLVRLATVAVCCCTGWGVLLYFAAAVILPDLK